MFESTDERDAYIFNLCTESGKSYDEVAEMMELSKDRISKIVADRIKNKQKWWQTCTAFDVVQVFFLYKESDADKTGRE